MEYTCPHCAYKMTIRYLTCPKCKEKIDWDLDLEHFFPSGITTISGEAYEFSSASSATATFTAISDIFEKKPISSSVPEMELLEDEHITKEDLEVYVQIGYLKRLSDDFYILTERGKKALEWNREFKRKWQKHLDNQSQED